MADKQKLADTNTTPLYDALEPHYQKAIELKIRGYTMLEIGKDEEVKATHGTVRQWFMTGGLLAAAYKEREAEWKAESQEYFDHIDEKLRALLPKALTAIAESMNDKRNFDRWRPAVEVLAHNGLKPTQKVELQTPSTVTITIEPDDTKRSTDKD